MLSETDFKTKYSYSSASKMIQQYLDIKFEHQDAMLFFRVGDFYELLFEDAIEASQILGILLTKKASSDIPMCGVPHHAINNYLNKLVSNGLKAALCEQIESAEEAKKRGANQTVKREVVEVITQGTITEESILDTESSNYLVSVVYEREVVSQVQQRSHAGLDPASQEALRDNGSQAGMTNISIENAAIAYLDLSTFDFAVMELPAAEVPAELIRLEPKELLTISSHAGLDPASREISSHSGLEPESCKIPEILNQVQDNHKSPKMPDQVRHDYRLDSLQQRATDLITAYIAKTQPRNLISLPEPEIVERERYMLLDTSSLRGLEIVRNQSGGKKHTVLASINHTVTKGGARLLAEYLTRPLKSKIEIEARLEIVQLFYDNHILADNIRKFLKSSGDIERLLARIGSNKAAPKDLLFLRRSLEAWKGITSLANKNRELAEALSPSSDSAYKNPPELTDGHSGLEPESQESHETPGQARGDYRLARNNQRFKDKNYIDLIEILSEALLEEGSNALADGGYIKSSYHPKLAELNSMLGDNSALLEKMRRKYQQSTGIETLKICHNNVLGLFIEVPAKHAAKMTDPRFIHRGTTSSVLRFTAEGLQKVESDMVNAKTLAIALEREIFEKICASIVLASKNLKQIAKKMAELDVFCSLAFAANTYGYVRPEIVDEQVLDIKEGRHIIVERSLEPGGFTPNDCNLPKDERLWLITGPNMGGKSTFLRQNALMAILAQMGSFVPATSAKVGIVDKIFCRIGAGDDMAKGQSTFMVEMLEVASILNSATKQSLVILDEVGRGTSTEDGLAIAQGCLEYIHDKIGCRGIFATHYHELIKCAESLKFLGNYSTEVDEAERQIVFLHKIKSGGADRSYGIHVAELAGLPKVVVERARGILNGDGGFEKT